MPPCSGRSASRLRDPSPWPSLRRDSHGRGMPHDPALLHLRRHLPVELSSRARRLPSPGCFHHVEELPEVIPELRTVQHLDGRPQVARLLVVSRNHRGEFGPAPLVRAAHVVLRRFVERLANTLRHQRPCCIRRSLRYLPYRVGKLVRASWRRIGIKDEPPCSRNSGVAASRPTSVLRSGSVARCVSITRCTRSRTTG